MYQVMCQLTVHIGGNQPFPANMDPVDVPGRGAAVFVQSQKGEHSTFGMVKGETQVSLVFCLLLRDL